MSFRRGDSINCRSAGTINRMPLKLESIDHIQVTVPRPLEAEALRFYIRDPGGNRIEVAQRLESVQDRTQPGEGS
jgi:hypothetical protein